MDLESIRIDRAASTRAAVVADVVALAQAARLGLKEAEMSARSTRDLAW
jgi:hypothetical protein